MPRRPRRRPLVRPPPPATSLTGGHHQHHRIFSAAPPLRRRHHSQRCRSAADEAASAPGDHLPWPAAQLLLPAPPEVDVVAAAWRLEHGGLKPSHSGEVAPPRGEVASPREGGRPGGGRCSTPACRTAGSSRGRPCTSPPRRVAPRARAPAAAKLATDPWREKPKSPPSRTSSLDPDPPTVLEPLRSPPNLQPLMLDPAAFCPCRRRRSVHQRVGVSSAVVLPLGAQPRHRAHLAPPPATGSTGAPLSVDLLRCARGLVPSRSPARTPAI